MSMHSSTRTFSRSLLHDDRGLSTLEYAVLFVIILVGALAVWQQLGGALHAKVTVGEHAFSNMLGTALHRGNEGSSAAEGEHHGTPSDAPGHGQATHGSASTTPQSAATTPAAAPGHAPAAPSSAAPAPSTGWADRQLGTQGKVLVGLGGATAGVAVGAGLSWATAYGSSLACGPAAGACAGAVTVALVGYGGYKLYKGGWQSLKGSFGRVFSSKTASVGDALSVGSTIGGLGYGAATSFGRGAAFQRAVVANGNRVGLAHREAVGSALSEGAAMLSRVKGTAPDPGAGVKSEALKNAVVDTDMAAGLQPYKDHTAKDFTSAQDPKLLAIREIADHDNRQVAEALRAAFEARGIKNVEIQQRTKSAASILGKLTEKENVKLSDIKDLSGIRINIKDVNQPGFKQHDEIVAVIKEVVQASKVKDYNKVPNEWGYTGRVHVFTESARGVSSEIQVGSRELSQFIETKFTMPNGGPPMEVHDLTGYKGQLYGKSLPEPLQRQYTELISEIGRANGAGNNAADVPALKSSIDAFKNDVQDFLTGGK